ncbi:MAG TPA: terminase B, partial [Limnochordales bacterium]
GENVVVRSGHGVGKTAVASWAIIWKLTCFPRARVPATAPTQHQLYDILWPEVGLWIERGGLEDLLEWTATRVAVRGHEKLWFAVARSSNRPERLAGQHAEHLLYVVDEASGVEDATWHVIDGARTSDGAVVLAIGNPTRRSGGFYDAFHRHRKFWHGLRVSSENSPRVARSWVEEMAEKWGRDSDIYRVRVAGEFPRGEADTYIPVDLVESCVFRDVPEGGPAELGVDVARYGDSETVIVARRGLKVLWLRAYRKRGVPEVIGLVVQAAKDVREETGADRIRVKVDDTGVGGGVTDGLQDVARDELPWLEVVPVNFGGPGNERYANETAMMWGHLRELMASGQLSLPRDDDLIGQLSVRKYRVDPRGRIRLESKEEMRRRGVSSPDRADALALAFWTPDELAAEPDIFWL